MPKILMVTGGTRGIGAAVSLGAAKQGYDLCLTYQNKDARAEDNEKLTGIAKAGASEAPGNTCRRNCGPAGGATRRGRLWPFALVAIALAASVRGWWLGHRSRPAGPHGLNA